MPKGEKGENQIILGGEVAIKRDLRDARVADQPVDAGRPYAFTIKKIMSGQQDTVSGGSLGARARLIFLLHRGSIDRSVHLG